MLVRFIVVVAIILSETKITIEVFIKARGVDSIVDLTVNVKPPRQSVFDKILDA